MKHKSIYFKGELLHPKSEVKRSICNLHLVLARKINKNKELKEADKEVLMALVDECYGIGKKMAAKLDYYHSTYEPDSPSGWKNGINGAD